MDFTPPRFVGGPLDGNYFTFTGMKPLPYPSTFRVFKATMAGFPTLNGQSVSYAVLEFPNNTVNAPHMHPRASELFYVLMGSLDVTFFVFPKGLVHFQFNSDANNAALALSAFGSASPGTVSVPNSIFNSTIDDNVLALSFKTDVATIQKIKSGLSG
ncbi:putative germin, rmlC-like cupin domain superfamily, rmlC-like jelly roll [Helianthus anomalus]